MTHILDSRRLVLRPWRDEDVDEWAAMGTDSRVMEFFPSTYDRSEAESTAARLRERLQHDGYGCWVIEVKGGPAFAGVIALQEVPFEAGFTPALEVGWRLAYRCWGRGYATEGAHKALAFAFDELDRKEVVAMTAVRNERSQRVMRRLGMYRNPADDFDHPRVEPGHPLRRHVLYRISRDAFLRGGYQRREEHEHSTR